MKALLTVLMCLSFSVWAEDGEENEIEISDKQRCEEWAEMDGIAKEDLKDYMKECIASLGYEADENEEPISE
ncbi:hypothetical protein QNI23_011485 [Bermanella sp. WJH001]|uniref:hypothetical protein n=1 Tax=Bermanella sp. WJH001 TaxID=3048005 RepID=UPI0024BD852B|nr:hypothetical protein [Bermanella sp. WJH001]MDJ1537612.1 hypothetical protein [Bermanella sp. WJH001]